MEARLRDRRRFLIRAGAGAMSPLVAALASGLANHAVAQPARQRRILFYVDGMGRPDKYWPARTGGVADFTLGGYGPLEPFKNDILVVDGLINPFNVHLHGSMHAWTCLAGIPGEKPNDVFSLKPAGPTIDRVIGPVLSRGAPYPALSMFAWQKGPYSNNARPAEGPGRSVPPMAGPLEAYEQIIAKLAAPTGPTVGSAESAAQRLAAQKSIFDFVVDDTRRLGGRVGAAERAKLDQYTESLRALEQTLARLQAQAGNSVCQKPAPPDPRINEGGKGQYYVAERMTASLEFALAALSCGLTSVMALHTGTDGSMNFLGDSKIGTHTQGHNDGPEQHLPYMKYHAQNLVWLRSRLAALPDPAGGTMADTTAIIYTDEHGGRHHNGYWRTWMMAVGGAGVLPTNRFLKLPIEKIVAGDPRAAPADGRIPQIGGISVGTPAATTFLGDFFCALATAFGVTMDKFGSPMFSRGPLALG